MFLDTKPHTRNMCAITKMKICSPPLNSKKRRQYRRLDRQCKMVLVLSFHLKVRRFNCNCDVVWLLSTGFFQSVIYLFMYFFFFRLCFTFHINVIDLNKNTIRKQMVILYFITRYGKMKVKNDILLSCKYYKAKKKWFEMELREKRTVTKTITYGDREMWFSSFTWCMIWLFFFSIPKEMFVWVETRRKEMLFMYTVITITKVYKTYPFHYFFIFFGTHLMQNKSTFQRKKI